MILEVIEICLWELVFFKISLESVHYILSTLGSRLNYKEL